MTREMGFRLSRRHALILRHIALWGGIVLPVLLLLVALVAPDWARLPLAVPAALAALGGALVERWLFFAEAKHVAMLYYGLPAA